MTELVVATGNPGKLKEIDQLLKPLGFVVKGQKEFSVVEAEETGLTFVENAIIKARHACQVTGLPALADDSGIEIDALDGAPGIYSARYSGEGDQANNAKVLANMANVEEAQRSARFQCVLVYMRHAEDPTPQVFQGAWEGRILTEASGSEGFGYDPIFYVPSEQCSAAELSRERKNQLSHRGQAIQQLLARWGP